nr:chemotaxis protein CheW [Geoalkalibacter sp.]
MEHKPGGLAEVGRFNAVFFEESAEHLADMERLLLSLDPSSPDQESLNAIFRAAHSIKGGAGVFGFDDMARVTHHLESLLDHLRNRELSPTADLVDLVLQSGDVLAMQLAGHRDGAPVDGQAVQDIFTRLEAALSACEPEHPTAQPTALRVETSTPLARRGYHIDFHPSGNILQRGIRLENLFRELAELGELSVTAELGAAAELRTLDPELCHTRWQLRLVSAAAEQEIREIFEFVALDSELDIRVEEAQTAPQPAVTTSVEAPPDLLGRRAYDRDESAPGAFGRRGAEATEASLRVGVAKVDQLVNQVGELVITQSMLAQFAEQLDPVQFEVLHRGLVQLERNTRDLQASIMSIRLVPIGGIFSRFPRLVRDLAAKLGKDVELRTIGEGTELDKGLIEKIIDPLTHLVRNSLDHGIEAPRERAATGKNPVGTITLKASQVGGRILIEVGDDGAGLNREKILRKAAERGLASSDNLSDEEVWQLIFAPGFSTAEAVTDLSGRGVGMDVVLKNVQAIGGRVQVASRPGAGTVFSLSLPLTLAILDGLSVQVGAEKFIIPLNVILESFQPSCADLKQIKGETQVVQVRGDYLPVLPLHRFFGIEKARTQAKEGILVLVDTEGEKAALLVDELLGQHQVVIKSLETNYRKVEGTAGATILGDGKVALILDVGAVVHLDKNRSLQH